MTQDLTDWARCRRLAHGGVFLFCSWQRMDDEGGDWIRQFVRQAQDHGAEVRIMNGYVYLVWSDTRTKEV